MDPLMHVKGMKRADAEENARLLLDRVGLMDKADKYPRKTVWRTAAESRYSQGNGSKAQGHIV